jgi:hypothetical protein
MKLKQLCAPGYATIWWTPPTPGFMRQSTGTLSPTNWVSAPNGTNKTATVQVTLPARFCRLPDSEPLLRNGSMSEPPAHCEQNKTGPPQTVHIGNGKHMKITHQFTRALALSLACLGAGHAALHAQVIINPNPLSGTARLNNSDPTILHLLDDPGNEGFTNIYVRADSLPPAPAFSANSDSLPATGRLVTGYTMTVDSANPGIAYAVSPVATLNFGHQVYYFNARTSAPVVIGTPPPALDFAECVGVVKLRFVTSGGVPVPLTGGRIQATEPVTGAYTEYYYDIAPGATEQRVYLRGDATHTLDITVNRGMNFYTDRVEHYVRTNVAVTCDAFTPVDIVIPDAGTLGRITGNVDILGEFEAVVDGRDDMNYPD